MDDDEYRTLLESKRFDIVQNLQIERTFVFDYLRHKGVLDGEDCELIHGERTTPSKIGKFVDLLARKGPQAYQSLLESLQLEHPVLYEKLTGKEADATTSPIMTKLKKSFSGVGGPMGNSELEILTRHLERTYGDLHEMSKKFEQVVQHKKSIEEQLEITTSDLERHKEKLDFLEKRIDSEKTSSLAPQSNPQWTRCLQYIDNMRKEISDRDIYIIALQTNLMSTREEIEGLKKKNESMMGKNNKLQNMIEEMNESYQKKKCESMRLSERIERQGNEIRKAEETMRKYREYQFHNIRLREENEHLQEELDELRKWAEALKTRYDIVEYEKEKTRSDQSEIMAEYGSIQEELMKSREEMNEVQLVAADLQDRVRHLEHDRQTYKRQRDGALTARREAILDRDKAFLERDQALKKYNDLKSRNEEKLENKILKLKNYDEIVARNDVFEEEIKQMKIKLRKTEQELEQLRVKCGLDDKEKSDTKEEQCVTNVSEVVIKVSSSDNTLIQSSENGEIPRNDAKQASTHTTILESIKRRVAPPSPTFYENNFSLRELYSLPVKFASSRTSANFVSEVTLQRCAKSRTPIKYRQGGKEEETPTSSDHEDNEMDKEGQSGSEGESEETKAETSSNTTIINYL